LSEISRSVRCTSARSWRKVWSEAKNRITFAPSKVQSRNKVTEKKDKFKYSINNKKGKEQ
jgi:hypothetical protein